MAVDGEHTDAGRPGGVPPRRARQTRFRPIGRQGAGEHDARPDPAPIADVTSAAQPALPRRERGTLVRPELPPGLVSAGELARQTREAAQLHADAADLLARLDRTRRPPAAPLPPASWRAGRRFAVVALVLLLVLLAAAGAVYTLARDDAPAGSTGVTSSVEVGATPTVATATVQVDGERLHVVQVLPLGSARVAGADLVLVPALTPPLTGPVAQLRPRVENLRVEVGGSAVAVRHAGERWTVALPGGATGSLRLSYDVLAGVLRNEPSADGRALGLLLPLQADGAAPTVPTNVHGGGPAFLGLTCPGAPSVLCGRADGNGWTATLPGGANPAVLLQLDLDRA